MNKLERLEGLEGGTVFGSKTVLVRKDGNERYLNEVLLDAVDAERLCCGDTYRVKEQCHYTEWELPDGSRWVSVDGNLSSYARIVRRVDFRLKNNKWIEKKNAKIWDETYSIPGQWCMEHRYWLVED